MTSRAPATGDLRAGAEVATSRAPHALRERNRPERRTLELVPPGSRPPVSISIVADHEIGTCLTERVRQILLEELSAPGKCLRTLHVGQVQRHRQRQRR